MAFFQPKLMIWWLTFNCCSCRSFTWGGSKSPNCPPGTQKSATKGQTTFANFMSPCICQLIDRSHFTTLGIPFVKSLKASHHGLKLVEVKSTPAHAWDERKARMSNVIMTEEDPAYAWDGGKGKYANMLSDAFQTLVNKILADTVRTLADRMT